MSVEGEQAEDEDRPQDDDLGRLGTWDALLCALLIVGGWCATHDRSAGVRSPRRVGGPWSDHRSLERRWGRQRVAQGRDHGPVQMGAVAPQGARPLLDGHVARVLGCAPPQGTAHRHRGQPGRARARCPGPGDQATRPSDPRVPQRPRRRG